jgi:tetratricopeptide (TPR) repeat protein
MPCGRSNTLALAGMLVLAFAGSGQGGAAQAPLEDNDRLKQWLEAVLTHTSGEPGKLALEMAGWPGPDLERVITDARRHARTIARTDAARANDILLRGAALHADLARLMPDELTPRSPNQMGVYIVRDGRWQGLRYPSIHWQLGRSVLDGVFPTAAGHPGVLAWYRETSLELMRDRALAEAMRHLARARQLFPNDPPILFLSGVLHERFSSSALQAASASLVEEKRGTASLTSARGELTRAERFFRESITAEPSQVEARVRHGRVLGELGRHDEATTELRYAIEHGADGIHLFYAQLFLGHQEEALGREESARQAFERAAELYPKAQTPRLALSQLARRSGRREAARTEVEYLASLPADERRREDPWWSYYDVR